MPKKNGKSKTYSFSNETIQEMRKICEIEKRTETSLIEYLIYKTYKELFDGECKQSSKG